MIRFAVPSIGGANWFGGWMFMRNLVRALAHYGDPKIEINVFIGEDRASDPFIAELQNLPRTRIIVDHRFSEAKLRRRVTTTLIKGRNNPLLDVYKREHIDVALDCAIYYGWRNKIPTISWLPDFQHRILPNMFGPVARWRRELGFRAQIAASQAILISSTAAERDCLKLYPSARGRTNVASFAVPVDNWPDLKSALERVEELGIQRDFIFLPNQLWYHKNHLLAIKAAGILRERGSKRLIVATGRGLDPRRPGYREELSDQIKKYGASPNFLLLDGVDHIAVQSMMIVANALLNPSRFEGWSTTVEEAKAVGIPMLLSDIPVHREQAPQARFFPIDDAISLANAIEDAPARSSIEIELSRTKALKNNINSQELFANRISEVINKVFEEYCKGAN